MFALLDLNSEYERGSGQKRPVTVLLQGGSFAVGLDAIGEPLELLAIKRSAAKSPAAVIIFSTDSAEPKATHNVDDDLNVMFFPRST